METMVTGRAVKGTVVNGNGGNGNRRSLRGGAKMSRAAASRVASVLLHAFVVAMLLVMPRDPPKLYEARASASWVRLAPLTAPAPHPVEPPANHPRTSQRRATGRAAPAPKSSQPPNAVRTFRRPRPAEASSPPVPHIEAPQPTPGLEVQSTPLVPARVAADLPRFAPSPVRTGEFRPAQLAPDERSRAAPAAAGFDQIQTAAGGRTSIAKSGNASVGAFGSATAASPERPVRGDDIVSGGFGAAMLAPPGSARTASSGTVDSGPPSAYVPAEIQFKPRAEYTDAARIQHIEGEVLLEMRLTAGGEAQLVRLVQGLGHGLDQAAEAAARQIRFRPAQRSGVPVDSMVVVHIEFQLAY